MIADKFNFENELCYLFPTDNFFFPKFLVNTFWFRS